MNHVYPPHGAFWRWNHVYPPPHGFFFLETFNIFYFLYKVKITVTFSLNPTACSKGGVVHAGSASVCKDGI